MRNIKTGSKKDQRWRTADVVERLETSDEEFTFSYAEGDNIILMHPETYSRPRCRRTSSATACPSWSRT